MNKKLKDMAIHAFVRSYAKKGPLQNFFVFGYGSLMYPSGVNGRGMDYYYDWDSLKLARLKGYKRGMYAGHSIVSYYGILPCEDKEHTINGILMKIHTGYDLAAFLLSEGTANIYKILFGDTMYDLVDVTEHTLPYEKLDLPKGSKVHTLVCDKDHGKGRDPYPGYQERVWQGIHIWGKEFSEEFLQTGGVNPFIVRKRRGKNRNRSTRKWGDAFSGIRGTRTQSVHSRRNTER